MLYSENSRNLLLEKSKSWDIRTNKIYEIFKEILINKYIGDKKEAKEFYDIYKPEKILIDLKKINKEFKFNPSKMIGYWSRNYIKILYNYLNTSCIILDKFENVYQYNTLGKKISYISYSVINDQKMIDNKNHKIIIKSLNIIKNKLKSIPEVLCINITDDISILNNLPYYYQVINDDNKNELNKLENTIIYNNQKYILDSIILANYNMKKINITHAICGITCNKERYIYNGWLRSTIDPIMINIKNNLPCELMKYYWNIHNDNEFCLNIKKCNITNIIDPNTHCFSFSKGERLLIYIKDNNINIKSPENKIICPENKVFNPNTKRCINKNGITAKKLGLNK